jgi:hypothetical protein
MEELHILIDNLVDNLRRLRGKFSGIQEQEGKVEDVEVKGNDDALMERIMKSINENLSDPDFNVEKLTEDVGISRAPTAPKDEGDSRYFHWRIHQKPAP